jgi:putative oxidoreductase
MAQALHSERAMELSSQKNLSQQTMSQLKGCATAILFLRLFIGGVMLLHIIGKMQTYDNLVLEYPSIMGFSPATTLAVSMIVEGALAAMIMVGVITRFASMAMVVLTILSIIKMMQFEGMTILTLKIYFLYLGIYITLLISGSGIYGFNIPWLGQKNVPND